MVFGEDLRSEMSCSTRRSAAAVAESAVWPCRCSEKVSDAWFAPAVAESRSLGFSGLFVREKDVFFFSALFLEGFFCC